MVGVDFGCFGQVVQFFGDVLVVGFECDGLCWFEVFLGLGDFGFEMFGVGGIVDFDIVYVDVVGGQFLFEMMY